MEIFDVIEGALKDFQQMWADIGYTEEDQIKEVNGFVGSITKLCTNKVESLKEEKAQMMLDVTHSIDQIKKLAKQLDDGEVELTIWEDLGISPDEDSELAKFAKPRSDVLTLERIADYERLIAEAQVLRRERVDKVNALVVKLIDLWSLLEAAPADDFDEAVLAGNIGHSNEVLMTLDARLEKLLIEKEKRESKIRDYGTKINKLWDKLMVPTDEREEFFERSTQTLGPSAIRSCKKELERLESLYRDSLKILIEEARVTLLQQWDRLHVSKEERINFTAYASDAFTEALLTAHQEEIEKNEQLLSTLDPILRLIHDREKILKEKTSFERETSDPKRLLSKERDPGRLLREEKMRKLLDKKLPQIEAEIVRRLGDWETESGKVFMYEGKSYLEMLQLQLATTNSKIKKRKPLGERDVRDLPSNQSSIQPSTPSKIAPPRTPRAGVKTDLNATFCQGTTPGRGASAMKKPFTPARSGQAPSARSALTPRVGTPFAMDKKVSASAGKKAGAQMTGAKHSRPALTTLQLNGAPPKSTTSGSPPKRPRLSFD
ncbi:Microtubule associated protein (MAP65/ASE1 family) [Acanthamoeba castellanii str. Neff]|uniref:Microtubule associated protein (MAP65/ASE1 family) n=1 Tax=Acanthamoeba castellanii (strain ATCC 30010 / Neff) TaxID=1257118 RepID=L8H9E2_ACACF|nr:Microtubule associated protein (MAP65/ASE1 family) [Acanthamoeba castellanii str. Neff]ELR21805.1 Microtubule associated protein (MAP65/ASE1 family) [Acanthamoeba castellanii str. Neff]